MTAAKLRVLDLTDELASFGGRLFVGMGADVVRVEPDHDRPRADREEVHWHAGKRIVRADPGDLDDVVLRLLPGADVVLESGPVSLLRTPWLRERDEEAWDHVVHVVVTPFGLTGPCADWLADDGVLAAAGGMTWLGGDPGGPPTPPPRGQATHLAGAHAAIGALLALIARDRDGRGQLVTVSAQEAVTATLETGAVAWIHAGRVPGRTGGVYSHVAHRVFATSDGFVAGGYSGPERMWTDLLAWMVEEGEDEGLAGTEWQDPVFRWENRPHVDMVVADFCRRRTTSELAREARRRALPWAAVATPADLLTHPQLRERRFLVDVDTGAGTVQDIGFPYQSPGADRPVRLRAAEVVGADADWLPADATTSQRGRTAVRPRARRDAAALDGVRVLDLTWVLAGPYVTRTLADHGADILKVESRHRQDPTRFSPGMRLRPDAGPDDSGYFINFNRNKRSLTLNLRTAEGPALLRRLAAEVDVVVENFSPGTLDKWGLGWEQLREINPRAVLVSMSGVGATGPWRNSVTFADTLAAMSGLTHETGTAGRAPQGLTFGLGDMVAANAATLATIEYLHRGVGGHVDLSQLEAMAAHLGTALLELTLPDSPRRDDATTDSLVVRTAGEDRWLAVGRTPRELLAAAVHDVLGGSSDHDPVAALEAGAASWDADALAQALQVRGVAAYPVRDGRDVVTTDPQLLSRDFHPVLTHPLAGDVRVDGIVSHLCRTPGSLRAPAPLLGQHTDEVLQEILGLDHQTIRQLHERGVLQ